jgi:hypothetical protein
MHDASSARRKHWIFYHGFELRTIAGNELL